MAINLQGMRVAACVSGEMRNAPECLESLKEKVFAPLLSAGVTIETLACVRLDPWCAPAIQLPYLRNLRVQRNVWQDPSDIISSHNPVRNGQYEDKLATGKVPGSTGRRRAFLFQSYLQYYRSLAEVGEMKRQAEQQDGRPYDLVMRVRPDGRYENPLDTNLLTLDRIWVPCNERFGGASDKFAIGPSAMMDVYFARRSFVKEYCQSHELIAEQLLVWQLQKSGVPFEYMPEFLVSQTSHFYDYCLRPDSEAI